MHKPILLFPLLLVTLGCSREVPNYELAMKHCEDLKEIIKYPVGESDTIDIPMMPASCLEGYALPEFSLQTIDGETITSESLKGKLSIINFWFETCPPCVAEIPGFNALVEKYGDESVNYIAISTFSKKDVKDYVAKEPFNFKHVADGEAVFRQTFKSKWGFPLTIVSDRENRIVKSIDGGSTDSTAIARIINELEPIFLAEGIHPVITD